MKWKEIPEFDGYRISDTGQLQSCFIRGSKSRLSIEWINVQAHETRNGYLQVTLYRRGTRHLFSIHSLVLLAFVGPCPGKQQACHGNGKRTDNRLENLRWDSVSANHADKNVHGTMPKGSIHPQAKLKESQVLEIRKLLKSGSKLNAIGRHFGVSGVSIGHIKTGRTWSHVQ
jgi:HNH endonuclease/NUMOD4 motif